MRTLGVLTALGLLMVACATHQPAPPAHYGWGMSFGPMCIEGHVCPGPGGRQPT